MYPDSFILDLVVISECVVLPVVPFKCYVRAIQVLRKRSLNVTSWNGGEGGVKFPGEKRYVTLEWPKTQ